MPSLRHLKRYSTWAPGKWCKHHLHHREFVQVGVEQGIDDHRRMLSRNKSPDQIGAGLPMPSRRCGGAQSLPKHRRQRVLIREIKIALRSNRDIEFFASTPARNTAARTPRRPIVRANPKSAKPVRQGDRSAQVLGLMQVFGIDQTDELRMIKVITPDKSTETIQCFGRRQITVQVTSRPLAMQNRLPQVLRETGRPCCQSSNKPSVRNMRPCARSGRHARRQNPAWRIRRWPHARSEPSSPPRRGACALATAPGRPSGAGLNAQ